MAASKQKKKPSKKKVTRKKATASKARSTRGKTKASKARPQQPATRKKGALRATSKDVRPQNRRSKSDEAMEARLKTLEAGTRRYSALKTAIVFKRSWLALAKLLAEVHEGGDFKEWGYRTFDAYCNHELFLRKDTANKLLRSYNFLASHETRVLETAEDGGKDAPPLPSFQALDVLAEARTNPYLNEKDYRDLRDQVFRDDPSPAQVRKIVRERAPESVKKQPVDPMERMRKALAMAERLYGVLLEDESVPTDVTESLEKVVGGLRKLIED